YILPQAHIHYLSEIIPSIHDIFIQQVKH
ncbi:MAG: hypothetical protein JWQ25_798, partial [Daejeonella sp.]|nr:hypothetical protein [Daejeonella sp.]